MKHFILANACFLIYLSIPFFAQAQLTQDWVSRYNGPASKFDGTRAMTIDADNNIYVTGPSEGKKGNVDYVTVKYNSAGQELWVARYNGTGNGEDWPYAVEVDAGGNVYVTGRSVGNETSYDYATIKYGPAGGNPLWVKRTTRAGYDVAKDVEVDAAGNVYVTGYINGNSVSGSAISTIKYSGATGDSLWGIVYDGLTNNGTTGNYEESNSLAVDGSGNIYVTGQSAGMITIKYHETAGIIAQEWVRKEGGTNGQEVLIDGLGDIVVTGWGSTTIKFNTAGDVVWKTVYPGNAAFQDMVLDAAGNIYITGYSRENGTSDDYRTVKYNSAGVQQWSMRFNGNRNGIDLARAIAIDGNGNVYVTGRCELNDGSRNGKVAYGNIMYDNNGNELGQAFYDGEGFCVVTDSDGNAYVSGQNATKTTYFDVVTIKYITASTSPSLKPVATINVVKPQKEQNQLGVLLYPNPSNTHFSFRINSNDSDTRVFIRVLNVNGQVIDQPRRAVVGENLMIGESLKPGNYLVEVRQGEERRVVRLVKL